MLFTLCLSIFFAQVVTPYNSRHAFDLVINNFLILPMYFHLSLDRYQKIFL